LLENSPEFSQYASYTANDGSAKMISSRELPVPEDGTMDINLDFFDADEEGPNERSKKYLVSIAFITRHETNMLKKYV
jgi:eukaryotic translation initiation factor 2C